MFNPNSRNKYDKKDSLELGQISEEKFVITARNHGWIVEKVSDKNNIDDHFDFIISKNDESFRVEVKSLKRIKRSNSGTQDEYIWIEFHGVRKNDKGWLFGLADLIAFEMKKTFRLVKRKDLVYVVNKLVNFRSKAISSEDALYKIYSRVGRPDKISLIKSDDLLIIVWAEWEKLPN